jgi:hypothetical protein
MMMAAIMIETNSAMPTAVITESSENTISSSSIWMMTPGRTLPDAPVHDAALHPQVLVNLTRALEDQERAAASEDAATGRTVPRRRWWRAGRVRLITQRSRAAGDADEHREKQAGAACASRCPGGSFPRARWQ